MISGAARPNIALIRRQSRPSLALDRFRRSRTRSDSSGKTGAMVAPVRGPSASPRAAGRHAKSTKLKTYQTSLGFYDQAVAAPLDEGGAGGRRAPASLSSIHPRAPRRRPTTPTSSRRPRQAQASCSGDRSAPTARSPRAPSCRPISWTVRPSQNPSQNPNPSPNPSRSVRSRTQQNSHARLTINTRKAAAAFEGRAAARRRAPQGRSRPRQGAPSSARAATRRLPQPRRHWTMPRREHDAKAEGDRSRAGCARRTRRGRAEPVGQAKQKLEEALRRARVARAI